MTEAPLFVSRRRRFRVLGIVAMALATLFWAAMVSRFVLHGPVDAGQLALSVNDTVGSNERALGGVQPCEPAGARRSWRCFAGDGSGSGGESYLVRLRGDSSCWNARALSDEYAVYDMPARPEGCVRLWQWSLLDLLGGEPIAREAA